MVTRRRAPLARNQRAAWRDPDSTRALLRIQTRSTRSLGSWVVRRSTRRNLKRVCGQQACTLEAALELAAVQTRSVRQLTIERTPADGVQVGARLSTTARRAITALANNAGVDQQQVVDALCRRIIDGRVKLR